MTRQEDTIIDRIAIWFGSIFRWAIGLAFIGMGYSHLEDKSAWIMILIGSIFFITGFFRPRRCLDGNCKL